MNFWCSPGGVGEFANFGRPEWKGGRVRKWKKREREVRVSESESESESERQGM